MRLGQIKKLVEDYDNTIYSRKLYWGDHNRATLIKEFLKHFKESNDYYLNVSEHLQLAKIICPLKDDLALVRHIKKKFTSPAEFFEVFSFLQSRKFNDEILRQIFLIPFIYYPKLFNLLIELEINSLLNFESVQNLLLLLHHKVPTPEQDHFIIKKLDDVDLI